jgi:hydrogenase maturation factor
MEHDGPVELNIGNICGGAVPEIFEHEMTRLLKNVADLNTEPDASRCITLEFKVKPSPDRKSAVVRFICKSKLAGVNSVAGSMFMSTAQGEIRAFTEDPRQTALFAAQPSVVPSKQ